MNKFFSKNIFRYMDASYLKWKLGTIWFSNLYYFWFSLAPVSLGNKKDHGLPAPLVISLTSYKPRFETLYPTLNCLLSQNIKYDRLILWISFEDEEFLPANIRSLENKGLEIRLTGDIRSYKKIVPALSEAPDTFIVTADDDVYYSRDWLRGLVNSWDSRSNQIVCHRGHQILIDDDGLPKNYEEWPMDVEGPVCSELIFPTGVGGVLYPPHSLSPEVTDENSFLELCPSADDIWLYFMGRLNNAVYKKTPGKQRHIVWPKSQETSLYDQNQAESGNNRQIKNMINAYGWPT